MSPVSSLLLYGSRARGDEARSSDVDLLGIVTGTSIEKSFDQSGVSLHLYPFEWMVNEARAGSLFMLHIAYEAVPIFDPLGYLDEIREAFVFKASYRADVELGCRIVAAVVALKKGNHTRRMMRRYFWGVRTALMAAAAEERSPLFSATSLEERFTIPGLASHIRDRANATPEDSERYGSAVYQRLMGRPIALDEHGVEDNLRFIFGLGGVATATAGEIIYDFP